MTTTQTLTPASSAAVPASAASASRYRALRRVLWGVRILLAALLFIGSAMPKFAGQADAVTSFDEIGWGQWFRYVTGAVEAAGAIGLVVPRLAGLAAVGLIGLMGGAVLTQLLVLDAPWALLPAAFAVVFAVIAWDRRAESRELLRSLKR